MGLVTRGRLSVQRVEANAWDTIHLLAEHGGWEEMDLKPRNKSKKAVSSTTTKATPKASAKRSKKRPTKTVEEGEDSPLSSLDSESDGGKPSDLTAERQNKIASRKRKNPADKSTTDSPRRSRRPKVER
jgi:hypothetical protein